MAQFAWAEQMGTISSTLHSLEERVEHGELAVEGLEEFKSAVDDLRLRAWGLLMATNAADYRVFQERFRIRRGKEICRTLGSDLRAGTVSGRHPELPELRDAAQDLAAAADLAQQQAF
jgi:hypothetical protein